MARYRKIDVRLWDDARFRTLSDDGKLLFLLMNTHPNQTMIGAMRMSQGALCADLGWLPERLAAAFAEVIDKGLAKHDAEASLLWLPGFLSHNVPESPNVVRAWKTPFGDLPECALKGEVWRGCERFIAALTEGYRKAFASLGAGYGESGAGTGAGAGEKTGAACAPPAPPPQPASRDKPERPKARSPQPPAEPEAEREPRPVAEGAEVTAEARALLEAVGVPAPAKLVGLAAAAVRLTAVRLACTARAARLLIERQAQLAKAAGETVNSFWFEDCRYEGERREPVRAEEPTPRPTLAEQLPAGLDASVAQAMWEPVCRGAAREINKHSYDMWVRVLRPLGVADGVFYVRAPTEDFCHVGDKYSDVFAKFLPQSVDSVKVLAGTG